LTCLFFLQVSLFIVFSTEALETVYFTDSTNPYYFVDGRLTLFVRLSVAFGFCVLLLCAMFVIRNTMGELPRDAGIERQRRLRLRSTLRESRRFGGALGAAKEKAA